MFSRADKSLKDETHLLLIWDDSLVTLDTCQIKGRISESYSGEKANPFSNIYSNIYKMKTNESCFPLLKMVACTGPSAAQLEDWSTM